jgi:hypothetical protein
MMLFLCRSSLRCQLNKLNIVVEKRVNSLIYWYIRSAYSSTPDRFQRLASVQHARQRRLLRRRDGQRVHALDAHPHLRVCAVVACE